MILFDFPEEKSTLFKIYLPSDLLEQIKAQQHHRLKAEFNRKTFDNLLKKLAFLHGNTSTPGKPG